MEFNWLHSFVTVARTGSFSGAAEQMYLTQPAVSKRIAALEQELGVALFDRIGRSVYLTEAGKALLPRAKEVINDMVDLKRFATSFTGEISGPMLIGTSHHIGLHRLPSVIRNFTNKYRDVNLDIRFLDSEAACWGVQNGELELAVVTLPETPPANLIQTVIWEDPLVFVVSADHSLALNASVTLEELFNHPAVLPGQTTYTRGILERAIEAYNFQINIKMSTNYLETIKMLVSINQGWSLLPASMVSNELVVLELPLQLKRELGLVTHASRTLSNAAIAFCDCLGLRQ